MILTTKNFESLEKAFTAQRMPKHVTLDLMVSVSDFKQAKSVGVHWFVAGQAKVWADTDAPRARKSSLRKRMRRLDDKPVLLSLSPRAFEDLAHKVYARDRLKVDPEGTHKIRIFPDSFSLWRTRGKGGAWVIAAAAATKPWANDVRKGMQLSLPGFDDPEGVRNPTGFRAFNDISPGFF
jgi:hypothetical protein